MRKTRKEDAFLGTSEGDGVSRSPSLFRSGRATAFLYTSLFLNFVLWALPLFFIGIGEGTVVLRYNAYFGVDLTGSPWQALLIPCMTSAFFVANAVLAFVFIRKGMAFSGTLLMVASFFLYVAAIIAISALIFVN
jgi:hypothetical protein